MAFAILACSHIQEFGVSPESEGQFSLVVVPPSPEGQGGVIIDPP